MSRLGDLLKEDDKDDFVLIYKPNERTYTIPNFNRYDPSPGITPFWTFFGIGSLLLIFLVCVCVAIYLAMKRRYYYRRPPRAANTARNTHSSTNRAFELDISNGGVSPPPTYSAVALPSDWDVTKGPRFPVVGTSSKKLETPPPAYNKVPPFRFTIQEF